MVAISGATTDSAAPGTNARAIAVKKQLKVDLARIRERKGLLRFDKAGADDPGG